MPIIMEETTSEMETKATSMLEGVVDDPGHRGHQGAHHISVLDHLVFRALLTHGGIVAVQHIEDLRLCSKSSG